jgi:hypothetical protein
MLGLEKSILMFQNTRLVQYMFYLGLLSLAHLEKGGNIL